LARQQFARRLRDFRVSRGFKTARSLARALGIDENRYTRYERAEVEPDLGLIQQICETLRLTPNDLFGPPFGGGARVPAAAPGFSEPGLQPTEADDRAHRDTVAWHLACAVAELQSHEQDPALANATPLATLQRAARLFADLERRPFAALSEILLLPSLLGASQRDAQHVGELIEGFTRAAS
jgi:transcriptional regulator with XRE-family HTH domain